MFYRAAIQRRGSILAWIVILSVYDEDTIAIDLFHFCADLLIYEINYWVFKEFQFTCNNFCIFNN